MSLDLSRVKAMALKECKHIIRDKFTVIMGFCLPIALILFFGFVIELNYDNINILIKDDSNSGQSREFVEKLKAGGYFNPVYFFGSDILEPINKNQSAAAAIIDKDFGKNIKNLKPAKIQILLDGSDGQKAGLSISYISGILEQITKDLYGGKSAYEIRTRFLFNPQLNGKWFTISGLMVVIIGLLSILMTALTISKEWEKGSMELLLSTRIKPIEIVLGKIAPYIFLSFIGALLVFITARTIFGIPFNGNILLFWIMCFIYIVSCLSLGILISVIARQQQLSMMISMVIGLMPSMLLSGFIFPIENMPLFFRILTFILPQRWFMEICRGVFLRGAGFTDLFLPLFMLCLFCFLMIIAACKKFKTDIEI
ncbi:MAG: ABC transporter permease [Elusimicrobiota bacterium]|jgi:ABC-2 type transport system permease protein|nr:ABC transporter permease [Elusimicrobiota bacterium]